MIKGAWPIVIEDGLRCTNLHVDDGQIVAEAVVDLSCQPVPLFSRGQVFNLGGVFAQSLVSLSQFCAGLALARRHARENYYEDNPGSVNHRDGDRVDPSTAQDQRSDEREIDQATNRNHPWQG